MTKRKAPEDKLKMGRPTVFTERMVEDLLSDMETGTSVVRTCAKHGIHPDTFYKRLRADPDFFLQVKKSEYELESKCLDAIRTGEQGWQGSAWLMERRFPNEWAMRVKLAVMEREAELHERLRAGLTPAEYMRVIGVLAGRDGEGMEEPTTRRVQLTATKHP